MKKVRFESSHLLIEPMLPKRMYEEEPKFISDLLKIYSAKNVGPSYGEKVLNSDDDAVRWIFNTALQYDMGTGQNYFIYLKETGELIGVIEVLTYERLKNEQARKWLFESWPELKGSYEIEYYLNNDYANQQVMSGAVKALTDSMISQAVPAVNAHVLSNNPASIAVLQKAGFREVGRMPQPSGQISLHYVKM